ncbi:hypothetical protein O3Q52_37785, partial [Streptomyces sp. ActVer]|uniref:hypothetical protein n=1 Tax=Streptomyces sp. ActVer TaxID=3014558 RepID=UPI0022B2CC5B
WGHQVDTNQLWFRSITVSGYNAGGEAASVPAHGRVLLASGEVTVTDDGEAKLPADTTAWWIAD